MCGYNGKLHVVLASGMRLVPDKIKSSLRAVCAVDGGKNRKWALLIVGLFAILFSTFSAFAQQPDPAKPVVVQPGAPGAPSKILPPSTRAALPPRSLADVEFMQGMIMHHEQAVEMTAMIPSHTQNKDLASLGARISSSQSDEIKFMKRWLAARGESVPKTMTNMPGMDMSHETSPDNPSGSPHDTMALMPGMLTPQQMEALRAAKGAEFDHLFLVGMIQHHNGALTMVKDLFDTAGAGQDAELFNFATDADNTQRAEIRIMQTMLEKEKEEPKEKR
jgi:uncharacterized protein (DUF305 family)